MTNSRWLTIDAAARESGLHVNTIRRHLRELGSVRRSGPGGRILIHRGRFARWVKVYRATRPRFTCEGKR